MLCICYIHSTYNSTLDSPMILLNIASNKWYSFITNDVIFLCARQCMHKCLYNNFQFVVLIRKIYSLWVFVIFCIQFHFSPMIFVIFSPVQTSSIDMYFIFASNIKVSAESNIRQSFWRLKINSNCTQNSNQWIIFLKGETELYL